MHVVMPSSISYFKQKINFEGTLQLRSDELQSNGELVYHNFITKSLKH